MLATQCSMGSISSLTPFLPNTSNSEVEDYFPLRKSNSNFITETMEKQMSL